MAELAALSKTELARRALDDDPKYRTWEDYAALEWNSWLQVTDEQPFAALETSLQWEPFLHVGSGDGVKTIGFKRSDGMGFTVPTKGGSWWAAWRHPMNSGMGWHHHALGTYGGATSAAMAFDTVYALERHAGNIDRCPEIRQPQR